MVTNDRRFFWILEAILGVLVLLTIAVMFSGKGEKDKIAVIVRNSDAEKWAQFISGVKAAASDAGVDIVIASTGGFSSLAEEGALIQQEIRSGADALILQPVPGEDEKELLQKAISGVPVILVHNDFEQETGEAGFPVIKADNYAMGETLAQMLLEDYAGTLEDKTIGIVNDRLKSEAAKRDFLMHWKEPAAVSSGRCIRTTKARTLIWQCLPRKKQIWFLHLEPSSWRAPAPQKKKEKYTEHWFMELQLRKRRSIIWIMIMSADW